MARLADLAAPPGATCQLAAHGGSADEVCGKVLQGKLTHAFLCNKGAALMRAHKSPARALGDQLTQAGAFVDYERVVPQLARHASEHAADAI